jgi:hypothetical protein
LTCGCVRLTDDASRAGNGAFSLEAAPELLLTSALPFLAVGEKRIVVPFELGEAERTQRRHLSDGYEMNRTLIAGGRELKRVGL